MRGNRDGRVRRQLVRPYECVFESPEALHGTLDVELACSVETDTDEHVSRHRPSELPTETFDRPLVHRQAQLRRGDTELAVWCRHAQVASGGQLCSGTECRTIYRRQGETWHGRESTQCRGQGAGELVVLHPGEIRAGTKGGRRAREDHHSGTRRDVLLDRRKHHESLVVHGVATCRAVDRDDSNPFSTPFETDGCLFCVGRLYHQNDFMASEPAASDSVPPGSGQTDMVRARRQQVAKYTLLANRIGYLLYALAIACFVIAFAVGFSGAIVTVVTVSLVAGSVLLAPSIVLGYAVKAAEREDRENGL